MTTPTPLQIQPFGVFVRSVTDSDRAIVDKLTPEQKKYIAVCSCFSTSANAVVHPLVLGLQADWLAGKFDGSP